MTHCNLKMTSFSSLGSKKIEADFNGGRITSDTGALLLREIEQQTGLIKAMNKAIPDPRDPARIEHDQHPCWPSESSESPSAMKTSTTTQP
jgi:hypothetical protein